MRLDCREQSKIRDSLLCRSSQHPDDDPEAVQTAYFWSRRRQVTAEEIGNLWHFADQLLLEYDAFDPAIDPGYLLGGYPETGKRYRVQNQGFSSILEPEPM